MLDVEAMALIPGAMFGQGSAAENAMPAEAIPGGGMQGIAAAAGAQQPFGPKMPAAAQMKADAAISKAVGEKQKEADKANPLFSFLGLPGTSWQDVGVFAGLAILFLVGVVLLFSSVGGGTGNAIRGAVRKL